MTKKVAVAKQTVGASIADVSKPQATASQRHARSLLFGLVFIGLVSGAALGGVSAWIWLSNQQNQQNQAEFQKLTLDLERSQTEVTQLQLQVDAMQGQQVMEESTRNGLEASLKASQAELGAAKDKLAFFDQLLPPGPAGSVSIRALDIEQQGPILQYRVLLMRNGADDKPFKGQLQFVAKGLQLGKTVKITLQSAQSPGSAVPVADGALSNTFELSFDQFQRGSGFLSIPPGFSPQTVTATVLEGSTVRVSRTVNLSGAD